MKVNSNSDLYDKLTNIETGNNALNFLESLKYLDNSKKLIEKLNLLKEEGIEFKIVKGFIYEGIEVSLGFNNFESCLIETKEDLSRFKFVEKIEEDKYKVFL